MDEHALEPMPTSWGYDLGQAGFTVEGQTRHLVVITLNMITGYARVFAEPQNARKFGEDIIDLAEKTAMSPPSGAPPQLVIAPSMPTNLREVNEHLRKMKGES